MESLKGNKTYIVAAIAGLATVAKVLKYIDEETWQSIMGFLGAVGGITLAAKINRSELETKHQINTLLGPLLPVSSDSQAASLGLTSSHSYSGLHGSNSRKQVSQKKET